MNPKRLFVGNLTYSVNEKQLWELFSRHGEVVGVRIIEGKGYGFVEMESYEDARAARNALNETEFEGRNLLIDDVLPRKSKPAFHQKGGGGRPVRQGTRTKGRTGDAKRRDVTEKRYQSSKKPSSRDHSSSRQSRESLPERTLVSAPHPPKRGDQKKDNTKPHKKPSKEESRPPKKTRTRFWPGGKR